MADVHKPAAPMGQAKPSTATTAPAKKTRTPEEIEKSRQEFKKKHGYFPDDETAEQQFRRLCVPRVEKTLGGLKALKNLSRLKPSDAYREKVITAIRESVTALDLAWKGTVEAKTGFQL